MALSSESTRVGFAGFATGLDSNAIIEALVGVRRSRVDALAAKKAKLSKQQTAFGTIRTKLNALREKADAINTPAKIGAATASTTDDSKLGASATGAAAPGTYDVVVTRLAQTATKLSVGYADKDVSKVGAGRLVFGVGGTNHVVSIDEDVTLEGLRDAINQSDAPITATIIDEGVGTEPFKLVLTAEASGSAGEFTVDLSQFVSTDVPFSVSTVRTGLNAQFSVNGIAVERPTNLADDVVEGVSFNLKQTGSATVTVTRDPGKVKDKIKAFVDAYNDVFTELRAQQNFAERDGKAVLYGEAALERIASTLKDAARGEVSGLDASFDALSDLGIRVDGKGKLTVKDEDLEAALSADYDAATKLFTRIGTGESRGVARAVAAEVGSVITGVIAQRTGSIGSRQSSLTKQITEIEARLEKYAESLRRKYANLETYVGRFQSYGSSLGAL